MSRSNLTWLLPATHQAQAATGLIWIHSVFRLITIESERKHTITTLYFSNSLTSHMQLKGRYALLVPVRAVCTVRIGLNFVKFNVLLYLHSVRKCKQTCLSVKYLTISTLTFIGRPTSTPNRWRIRGGPSIVYISMVWTVTVVSIWQKRKQKATIH